MCSLSNLEGGLSMTLNDLQPAIDNKEIIVLEDTNDNILFDEVRFEYLFDNCNYVSDYFLRNEVVYIGVERGILHIMIRG